MRSCAVDDYHFEPLGLTDYSFLVQETPERHMSVAGVAIFDAGPLRRRGGGIDFATIRNATAVAIEQIPRYRQKLMWRTHRELKSGQSPARRESVERGFAQSPGLSRSRNC